MTEWVRHTYQNIKIWAHIAHMTPNCNEYPELSTKPANPQLAAVVSVQYHHDATRGGTKKMWSYRSYNASVMQWWWAYWDDQTWEQTVLCYDSDFTLICRVFWVILCACECQQVKGRILIAQSSVLANLKCADVICHAKYFNLLQFVLVFPPWYFITLLQAASRDSGDTAMTCCWWLWVLHLPPLSFWFILVADHQRNVLTWVPRWDLCHCSTVYFLS